MALVERIMRYVSIEPNEDRWISVHQWYAVMGQLARGELTRQQVIDFYAMTAADIVDLDNLIARYNTKTDVGNKALFISAVHEIFLLAETRTPGYTDPSVIRTRISRA